MKRTKIVCTIGPASAEPAKLEKMVSAGMNVARLNFSHGDHKSHKKLIKIIRKISKKTGRPLTILADMQGPKIRLGDLPEEGVEIKNDSLITFTTSTEKFKDNKLPVTYKNLHKDVKKGNRILIDDGILEVKVTAVKGKEIVAKVVNGGKVTSHKGMNFPDTGLSISSITEKDREDLKFAVQNGADWIAMSFVMHAKDVKTMRRLIRQAFSSSPIASGKSNSDDRKSTGDDPKIIVKIEKHEALTNFDKILEVADAVMVARGDLGVETAPEDVPIHQKEIIQKCRLAGKPVIVATQMLDSMIRNPRPTRAEVSDVANAIIDHADGIMLSGESATGNYPVEAVKMMQKIAIDTEASAFDDVHVPKELDFPESPEQMIVGMLAALVHVGPIDAAVTSAEFGELAERMNQFRPEIPMYVASKNETEVRQWNIRWGINPIKFALGNPETFGRRVVAELKKQKKLKKNQRVAVLVKIKGQPHLEIQEV